MVARARRRALAMAVAAALAAPAQQPVEKSGGPATFQVSTSLVVVNVTVRDRSGKAIEGLKKEDFQLYEDGKPQQIAVFEMQTLTAEALPPLPPPPPPGDAPPPIEPAPTSPEPAPPPPVEEKAPAPGEVQFKDKRLIVLFFDFASMPVEDQIRAQEAAIQFLENHMTASDMVSLMTFSNTLKEVEEFTSDRARLVETIRGFRIGEMSDLAGEETGEETGEAVEEDEGNVLFTAGDTEFNIFNTDRKLSALDAAARALSVHPEKKALVYLSSGLGKTGLENQSQLRATINSAVMANVAFYPIDARGLKAMPPAGDASVASPKGTAVFSGKPQREQRAKFNNQQETLYSLAADTGGKALLDTNDLAMGIVQAQKDIHSYYILGYYPTNGEPDGRFRKLSIRVGPQPRARLEYRPGYYAAKLWKNFNAADKERQLEEALQLGNPATDLPLAAEVNYFRLAADRYFAPVAVKIPGWLLPLASKGDSAELDFIGQIRDARNRVVASVRDTIRVKLSPDAAGKLPRRHLGYDTGFVLEAGEYRLKFLARENQEGKMGTFEARFQIPALSGEERGLRMSSVVWSGQREPLAQAVGSVRNTRKTLEMHPLIQEKRKLIPSITRVFRRGQPLYVYFEVYDPGTEPGAKLPSVTAALSIYQGRVKTFESQPVRVTGFSPGRPMTIPVQLQASLDRLRPGEYVCQLTVVDEWGKKVAFPRSPLLLLP